MKHNILVLFTFAAFSSLSCTQYLDDDVKPGNRDFSYVTEAVCTIPPIIQGAQTKTSLDGSGSFSWSEGDMLSFWPKASETFTGNSTGVMFKASEDGESVPFIGDGWGLIRGKTYHTSYPYTKDNTSTITYLSYLGQKQRGNNNTDHLGKYDYLCAATVIPSEGDASFDFQRLGCLEKFNLEVPNDMSSAEFVKLKLTCSDAVFVHSCYYDPSGYRGNPEIIPSKKSKSIALDLENVTADNGCVQLYMMLSPAEWSEKEIMLTLYTSESYIAKGTIQPSSDQEAGKGYSFGATLTSDGTQALDEDYVDMGVSVLWATKNIGAEYENEYGRYFAWGETKAYGERDETNPYYVFEKTTYCNLYYKYRGGYDGKSLKSFDDVAYIEQGARTPSADEWNELLNNCTVEWTTDYESTGTAGSILTSKTNQKKIFLPATGYRNEDKWLSREAAGWYWSSTLHSDYFFPAYCAINNSGDLHWANPYLGIPIRPVRDKTN